MRAALAGAVLLAGCGSGTATDPAIPLKSPAFAHSTIPARYTCDGQNVAPPFEWGAVPPGTRELVLFMLGFTPQGSSHGVSVTVEWVVAGLNPQLHGLPAGKLPPGARLALTSTGQPQRYSMCPAKGTSKQYQFELYALPGGDAVAPEFQGLSLLAALNPRGQARSPVPHGTLDAEYRRGK
ncbi:MAG TPA: hypothetical protein VGX72_09470 [Solirubrobacteraceae bacterium]|jgi:hypothetical protein|nr:hypothetical protein [Solirubrobacteraceae bacterium]